jgi:two-component system, OmpR family, response regulator QseB
MSHILIVEDDPRIVEFLQRGLAANGYATTSATDGVRALTEAMRDDIDLIVLDLGLPDLDGLAVIRALRGQGVTTPILVLTARGGVDATIVGLDAGADDYLAKPFRFDELLARVRARLRSDTPASSVDTQLMHGTVTMDLRRRQVHVEGRSVELSAREFNLLEAFLRRPGEAISREELLSQVWGYGHSPGSNVVDVYVGYLRRKLGNDLIATVRGVGYRLDTH